ncbi:MAG: TetR/AcrR family transcriptional regulator, partial [Bacillota bacterium]
MYEAFEALPEAKREVIRAAALEELVAHGYGGASTNAITRRAGISKGLLFHYFGSKKQLYLYLVDFVTERLFEYFDRLIDERPGDVFERMSRWSLLKFQMIQDNLLYYRFLFEAVIDHPKGLENEMAERERQTAARGYEILFKDLD